MHKTKCWFNISSSYFCQKHKSMETTKSAGKYWLYFLIALIVMIFMSIVAPEFFWVALPFVFTFFAKAMNLL